MSIVQRVSEIVRERETDNRARQFAAMAKLIMANRGSISEAISATEQKKTMHAGLGHELAAVMQACRGSRDISRATIRKAAASAMTLDTGALADYSKISEGFISSLQNFGVFDAMLPAMRRVAVQPGSIGATTTSATAYSLVEGQMKPISRLSLTGAQQTPQKVASVVVITQELARSTNPDATTFILDEMQTSVAAVTDAAFINVLTNGVSVVTSSGATAESLLTDISGLLQQVPEGRRSKYYLITTPLIAKMLSVIGTTTTSGQRAFPEMSAQGGMLCGIPCLVSDGVVQGQIILVDASGIAAGLGDVALQQLNEAVIQMDSAPDSPPSASTNFMSLWQNNQTAIVIERWFVATRAQSDAVAIVSNANFYRTGFSPP